MENKITVFKDSNGKLHESRKEYFVTEVDIKHKNNIEFLERVLEAVKADPENYYKFMKDTATRMIDAGAEKIDKEFNQHIDFIRESQKLQGNSPSEYSSNNYGEHVSDWNASPGSWLGISAQDLIE